MGHRTNICWRTKDEGPSERLLTYDDVADLLCCSRRTVCALKASGQIPFIKIGRLIRFREEDVLDAVSGKGLAESVELRH